MKKVIILMISALLVVSEGCVSAEQKTILTLGKVRSLTGIENGFIGAVTPCPDQKTIALIFQGNVVLYRSNTVTMLVQVGDTLADNVSFDGAFDGDGSIQCTSDAVYFQSKNILYKVMYQNDSGFVSAVFIPDSFGFGANPMAPQEFVPSLVVWDIDNYGNVAAFVHDYDSKDSGLVLISSSGLLVKKVTGVSYIGGGSLSLNNGRVSFVDSSIPYHNKAYTFFMSNKIRQVNIDKLSLMGLSNCYGGSSTGSEMIFECENSYEEAGLYAVSLRNGFVRTIMPADSYPFGGQSYGMKVNKSIVELYIEGSAEGVFKIDVKTGSVLASVPLSYFDGHQSMAVSGSFAFVLKEGGGVIRF